jgi:hypothetical protein
LSAKEKYSTLMLDLVATRVIEPEEEVFIDYDYWTRNPR